MISVLLSHILMSHYRTITQTDGVPPSGVRQHQRGGAQDVQDPRETAKQDS